jgi:hypothetical protein
MAMATAMALVMATAMGNGNGTGNGNGNFFTAQLLTKTNLDLIFSKSRSGTIAHKYKKESRQAPTCTVQKRTIQENYPSYMHYTTHMHLACHNNANAYVLPNLFT